MILVEGILVFFDHDLREMFDMKLFVDADPDSRLARRGKTTMRLISFTFDRMSF